jgi:hypothetical protein
LDASKIQCAIKNVNSNEEIKLVGPAKNKGWSWVDLQSLDKNLRELSISQTILFQKDAFWAYSIDVNHSGPVRLLPGQDFYASFMKITGHVIAGNEQKEIRAHLEILEKMDSTTQPLEPFDESNSYFMFNPWGNTIHNKPKTLKLFELTCSYME